MNIKLQAKQNINKVITVPGDKSISHRAIMFSAISSGVTEIEGFLMGADCLSTIRCFRQLGIEIDITDTKVIVHGKGLKGLKKANSILDVGNSGTTLRLITGLLAAQNFETQITGDDSIKKRPMDRVKEPLEMMGANIYGNYCPITIKGNSLHGIEYELPVASAQVKSAIILASLYSDSKTTIIEPIKTRNHTEIMLNYLGANIVKAETKIISEPITELYSKPISVPGDISSASYFIVAGLILPNCNLTLKNVGINETRTGIIDILKKMNGNINIINQREICGESVGDIVVKSSDLSGTTIGGEIIPRLIDEVPIIAVAACFASGKTIIKDASELKVKESNRIKSVTNELKKMGANIIETEDGMIIEGGYPLKGADIETYNDHRIAMSLSIAALNVSGETTINNCECVDISFPEFYKYLTNL